MRAPHLAEQLAVGDDTAALAEQQVQELELGGRQSHLLVATFSRSAATRFGIGTVPNGKIAARAFPRE